MNLLKKHITNLKYLFIVFFMIGGLYTGFGVLEGILGLGSGVVVITMLDKDYSECILIEAGRIIGTQLIIGIAAYIAGFNYLTLILFTFAVAFGLHYMYNHYKSAPRTMGFLFNYMFLVYFGVNQKEMPKLLLALAVSGIFIMILYYLFTKETYFKEGFEKKLINVKYEDKLEFKDFKLRYSVLNGVAFAVAIFVMVYFKRDHAIWLPITIIILLIPDKGLTFRKIIDRILGTSIGCVLFMIIANLITNNIALYILVGVAVYFMFFPMAYYKRAIFITYAALFANHMLYKGQSALYLDMYRVIFTIVGALIVFLIFVIEEAIKKANKEENI
ncbi:MAG: FUSC family protein [Sarcina sp.]